MKCWWCVFLLVGLLSQIPAYADDAGVAEQLFRDGKRLVGEGKLDEACRAFEGSYRKQPVPSTLLNLADCRERNGEFASAWAAFVEAERALRADPSKVALRDVAHERAAALESRLSHLRINVPEALATVSVEIRRGDSLLDHAEWNVPIAVDGGQHVVAARALGYVPWSTTVVVAAEGESRSVDVPLLTKVRDAPSVASRSSSRRHVSTYLVAGGGVMALGALALGYLAKTKLDDAKALCGADLRCDTEADRASGQTLVDASRTRGNLATALAVGGVVAVGVGVTLWVVRKPDRVSRSTASLHVTPLVAAEHLGIAVGGAL